MKRTWYTDCDLFKKWLEVADDIEDQSSRAVDEATYSFIEKEIPTEWISDDDKEVIIRRMREIREAGARPSILFSIYFRVAVEESEQKELAAYTDYQQLRGEYYILRSILLKDDPPHRFPSIKDEELREPVIKALKVLDEVFEGSDFYYTNLIKTYRPRGKGKRKARSYMFMGFAYHYLKEDTKLTDRQIYDIIADMLGAFTGTVVSAANVKQQVWQRARKES